MATIGEAVLTLNDWAKRLDPDGSVAVIAELLEEVNEVLTDMLFMEGNLPTGHLVTMRTGLPSVAWRLINAGITPSKGTTAQITEQTGMLEAWSDVDVDLANLNSNVSAFRLSEAMSFIEAMSQEFASTIFYGNSGTAPEEFTGLAPRYSDLSAVNAQNIIDGSGTGSDNSSIWLVLWGPNTVTGIFPKGSKAGIMHEDLGLNTVTVGTGIGGQKMRAYSEHWQWKGGIALKDWRYVVRIPNIDISNLVAKSSAADLVELMIKATHRIPNLRGGKGAFYMNRTCFQMLDIQRRDDVITGGGLVYKDVDGHVIPTFRNIPVRICDALTEAESRVT